jgi:hypothetical protein
MEFEYLQLSEEDKHNYTNLKISHFKNSSPRGPQLPIEENSNISVD